MARHLRELKREILVAVGTGFALAAAGGCAGESETRDGSGGTAVTGHGGAAGLGGSGGSEVADAGAAGTAATSGSGGTAVIVVDGRPFVVRGESRLPEISVRGVLAPDDDLSEDERRALAARFTECGRREHASIAAFAVLALELLAVGAPAALVEETERAALDEVEHARLAFALASRFAGREIAPGPLDVSGVTPSSDLADIAARAACEGCVLETAGAALALLELDRASDPEVRHAYARIARDEARHAALAYRLVAWAIAAGGARVRAAVARALEAPVAFEPPPDPPSAACGRYGMLEREAAFEWIAEARRTVIEPAVEALLSVAPA